MSKLEIVMRRDGRILKPNDRWSEQEFERVRTKKPVTVTVHHARNPEHLAKYWCIAAAVAANDPHFNDAEDADEWAKVKMPWMRRSYRTVNDTLIIQTKSISVPSMDQIEFERFYDRAIYLWSDRLGVDVETLKRQPLRAA